MDEKSRKAAELKLAALKELQRRQAEAPLLYYNRGQKTHPKQLSFHAAGKTYRRRVMFGGNRGGKSEGGAHEAIGHLYGYRFWEVPDLKLVDGDLPHRDDISPKYWIRRVDGVPIRVPNSGLIVTGLPRSEGIGEIIFPKIFRALPEKTRRKCKVIKGAMGVPDSLELPNGSNTTFASAEQSDLAFEGVEKDWAWVDEPVRQAVYNGIWRGLVDHRGPLWFTLTPITAKCSWLVKSLYMDKPDDVFTILIRQRDNPFLTEDAIRDFEEQGEWSDAERAARLYGTPELLGSRVFEPFEPTVHVIRPIQFPAGVIRGLTVDPHHKRPAYMLWWAFDPSRRIYYFYREWPPGNFFKMRAGGRAAADYAAIIRHAEAREKIQARICDPRFGKAEHVRHGFHESCWTELMGQHGLYFDANVPNVGRLEWGHQAINNALRYDTNFPVSPTNTPHMFIFDTCPNAAEAMVHYGFEDEVSEKVSEEFKDPVDAIRYTLLYPIPDFGADMGVELEKQLQEENYEDALTPNYYDAHGPDNRRSHGNQWMYPGGAGPGYWDEPD